jgi:hypothetical protein
MTYVAEKITRPVRSRIIVMPLRSCIKAQPWSLPKFIITLQSRVLHSQSQTLADSAAILRTFIHSLSKMLFNSFTASVFLLALTSSVNAQATGSAQTQSGSVFSPALGNPSPGFKDVQRPSQTAPCGDKPIGSNLDASTPIAVGSDGKFNIQVTSFGA